MASRAGGSVAFASLAETNRLMRTGPSPRTPRSMTDEVRARCTQPHFSTKRNNALFAGLSAGMGLGLSFITVILGHHRATLEIESQPLRGALFRVHFSAAG